MSDIVVCTACRGRKKVLSLGMMEKNCHSCKGIGHVMADKIDPVFVNDVIIEIEKPEVEAEVEKKEKDTEEEGGSVANKRKYNKKKK